MRLEHLLSRALLHSRQRHDYKERKVQILILVFNVVDSRYFSVDDLLFGVSHSIDK